MGNDVGNGVDWFIWMSWWENMFRLQGPTLIPCVRDHCEKCQMSGLLLPNDLFGDAFPAMVARFISRSCLSSRLHVSRVFNPTARRASLYLDLGL